MGHLSRVAPHAWLWSDQLIPETLMMALGMIMHKVLLDHIIQRPHVVTTNLFPPRGDCPVERIGVC
jgi:hypothetical protein